MTEIFQIFKLKNMDEKNDSEKILIINNKN